MQVQRPSAQWWSLSKRVTAQSYPPIGMKSAKRKLKWSPQILWNLENGKDSCNIISFWSTLILYSLFLLKIIKSIFLRMGIVTELLDFNKVRRFQEFCGIVATKDDDPRGIDAVMRWIYNHTGTTTPVQFWKPPQNQTFSELNFCAFTLSVI